MREYEDLMAPDEDGVCSPGIEGCPVDGSDEEGVVNEPEATPQPPYIDAPGIWSPDPPPFSRRWWHGYANVEVHPTAGKIVRWERVDEQANSTAADVLRQPEAFKLGEWLAHLPTDKDRAKYFEIKQVSITPSTRDSSYLQANII